jgi:hypothetical protein
VERAIQVRRGIDEQQRFHQRESWEIPRIMSEFPGAAERLGAICPIANRAFRAALKTGTQGP